MKWQEKSFDELGYISRGRSRHRPRNDSSLYGGPYPFVQTGDIKAANFYINEYSQTYNEKGLAQSKLWAKNTLCITIAANIAETAILGIDACFPDSIIGFVANEEVSDVRFIKYYFDIYKERIQRISAGAAQDNLSMEKLLTFKVPTPSLPTQQRIASILSAYDDLIENNLQRIQLLEEATSCDYNLMLEDSRSIITPLSQIATLLGGYAFKSKDWQTDGLPVIKIKNIDNNTVDISNCDCVPENVAQSASRFELFEGNLLIAMTGATVGKVGLMPRLRKRYYLNQRVGLFRSKLNYDITPVLFVTFNQQSVKQQVLNLASGAAQPNISGGQIESITIKVPKDAILLQSFCKRGSETIQFISNLKAQNHQLQEARDILLPKLMNGEIEV
jgi:type I restriction enzyme S subunit